MLIAANLLCKYVQNFRFKAHKSANMPRVVQLRSFGENALEKINAWNRMCFCFAGIALLYIISLITSMSCHQIRRTNYCHLALEDIDGKKNLQHRTKRTCSHQHSMAKVRRCMCGRSSWWQSRGALRPETKTGCGPTWCGKLLGTHLHSSIWLFCIFALHKMTMSSNMFKRWQTHLQFLQYLDMKKFEVQDIAMRFAEDLPYPSISNGFQWVQASNFAKASGASGGAPKPAQMLACWLIEKEQIQTVNRKHPGRSGRGQRERVPRIQRSADHFWEDGSCHLAGITSESVTVNFPHKFQKGSKEQETNRLRRQACLHFVPALEVYRRIN